MSFLDSRTQAARDGIGKPVRRTEDPRLVTGAGCYSDDFHAPAQLHVALVRSPHAHARIASVNADGALATPGVVAVLTGADVERDGLAPIPHRPVPTNPHEVPLRSRDGSEFFVPPNPLLAVDVARFAGEPVAMVIAETAAAAADGAERVVVDYEPRPAVVDTLAAAADGAPLLWDGRRTNLCVDSHVGDAGAVDAAFRRADYVVGLETSLNRVTGAPIEPRAALAVPDETTGRCTLYTGGGGVVRLRAELAAILRLPESALRVVARDVGGNYGPRNGFYPEYGLVAWAARRLGRPVKWTSTRHEAFVSDYQSRDLACRSELALDAEGNFVGFRGVNTSNVGAHPISFVPLAKGVAVSTSVYHVPAVSMGGRAVVSNTTPTTAYRSAGRPR